MSSAAYWTERVRRYGHTGWSDAATYWYDQRLRLKAIEATVLAPLPAMQPSALDFGCGVGDFSALLSRRFRAVIGYDVSADVLERARELNPVPNVNYTSQLDAALGRPHDLILSITVLQHVVRDEDLQTLLARFAQQLAPGGCLAVMKTSGATESHSGYLRRRTLARLLELCADAGLVPTAQHDFYHPSECPTPTYRRYRIRWSVRLLGRLAAMKVPAAEGLLRRLAQRHADTDSGYLDNAASPTKILLFARRNVGWASAHASGATHGTAWAEAHPTGGGTGGSEDRP